VGERDLVTILLGTIEYHELNLYMYIDVVMLQIMYRLSTIISSGG